VSPWTTECETHNGNGNASPASQVMCVNCSCRCPFLELVPIDIWLTGTSTFKSGSVTLAGKALVSGTTNGTGTNATFSDPAAIVVDASGNYFVADSQNHAIRKITAAGVVTTFAGQIGIAGSVNGTGTAAKFNTPSGLAFDKNGNLFVSDTGNSTIRKITPAGAVTTFAGVAGSSGFLDGATGSALFASPLAATFGWIHYLIFDLFIGAWESRDAQRRGIPHWAVIPCLLVTLLAGPIGLLVYLALRATLGRGGVLLAEEP